MQVFPYRDHSLQTNTEVLFLVKLQLLQGNPSLSDEFIVAKLVFVAHRQPEDRRQRGFKVPLFSYIAASRGEEELRGSAPVLTGEFCATSPRR